MNSSSKRALLPLLAGALLIAFIAHFLLFDIIVQPRKDFYNELWGPAHLLVRGESPYDTSSLNADLPAVWPPMAIGVFAPLGWLSEKTASQVWFLFNLVEIAAIVYLSLGKSKVLFIAGVSGLFAFFFLPVLNNLTLGQFSITAALSLMLAAHFAGKRMDWLSAFFLALGITKPQISVLAVLGIGYFYFDRFGYREAIKYSLKVLAMILLMSLPLFAASPAWMVDWLENMQKNPPWLHPSIYLVLIQLAGNTGIILWGYLVLVITAVSIFLWKKFQAEYAIYWSLGLTVIVSPYVWSWDFVLLLPIITSTFSQTGWSKKVFVFSAYCIGWLGMVALQLQENASNQSLWWVPFWYVGIALIILILDFKNGEPYLKSLLAERKQLTSNAN